MNKEDHIAEAKTKLCLKEKESQAGEKRPKGGQEEHILEL